MAYYIGCMIPRGADCEDGLKCRKGMYCRALEILDTRQCNSYFKLNGDDAVMFSNIVEARFYLQDILKKQNSNE